MTNTITIASRPSSDPRVTWRAQISEDRGRLQVVAVVEPSTERIIVELPNEAELKALLAAAPAERAESWTCTECGAVNDRGRMWCSSCSAHQEARS